MRSFSDSPAAPPRSCKRLGGYLVEAGLLTTAQVDVALNDQKITGMRFGEILAARGWVKQQTIDFVMKKVIEPERQGLAQRHQSSPSMQSGSLQESPETPAIPRSRQLTAMTFPAEARRASTIAKPLPSIASAEGDVSWVG